MYLSATQIGQKVGLSAAHVNILLEDAGLQTRENVVRDDGRRIVRWSATAEGLPLSEIFTGDKNGEPYEILLWDDTVTDILTMVKPPSRAEFISLLNRVRALEAK